MLTLDLPRLERDGALSIEATVSRDDPLWNDSGLRFDGGVEVAVQASVAGTGEFVVRVEVAGRRLAECRRCAETVQRPIDLEFIWVFGEPREEQEDDGGVRVVAADAVDLDLGPVLREELILELDRWIVCRAECEGLCPSCGVNLNEMTCDCSSDEPDPRWDALRALKTE